MNEAGSILVGHNGKVSSIGHQDYHLYESPHSMMHMSVPDEELKGIMLDVNDGLFEKLEKLDRVYRKQK